MTMQCKWLKIYHFISEDLTEEEKKLPLHKVSVIDEGEQRQVSISSHD